ARGSCGRPPCRLAPPPGTHISIGESVRDDGNVSERPESEHRELHMLDRKWNANDRQRQAQSKANVLKENPHTGENKPDDVAHRAENRHRAVALNVFTERKRAESRNLETLNAERNADDADTKQHANRGVAKPDDDPSAKDEPQRV